MGHLRKLPIAVTTDGSGANTGTFSAEFTGVIERIIYSKTDFADGVDFTITLESTGENLWAQNDVNASAVVQPRGATHDTAGAAALYAAGGTAVRDKIAAVNDRVKVAIAQGGATKSGTFYVIVS